MSFKVFARPVKALIVAAWGSPGEWRDAEYTILPQILSHPGLRIRAEKKYGDRSWLCISKCSTLALASYLSTIVDEFKVLIFGLDTLADPDKCDTDLRRCVERIYRGYSTRYLEECKCCDNIHGVINDALQLVITPGVGNFYGYNFRGGSIYIFNTSFSKILKAIEEFTPSFIVVDITHGVNYQMVAVLYATMAAATLMGKEKEIIVFNSEPYPRKSRGQMKKWQEPIVSSYPQDNKILLQDLQKLEEHPPHLNFMDVSDIMKTFRFIQAVADILRLRSESLSEFLFKEGKEFDVELQQRLWRLVVVVKLFENAAIGLTYPGATNERGDPLNLDLCSTYAEGFCQDIDYVPSVRGRDVVYNKQATVLDVMMCALEKVIAGLYNDLCNVNTVKHLIDYISAVKNRLNKSELLLAKLIVARETEKWGSVEQVVRRLAIECSNAISDIEKAVDLMKNGGIKAQIYIHDNIIEIEPDLARVLAALKWRNVKKMRCQEIVESIKNGIAKVREEKQKEKSVQSKTWKNVSEDETRNMCAHAGLSYDFITSITLVHEQNSFRITQIKFNKEKVQGFLNKLNLRKLKYTI
uniref:CRISPR system endoribonuclease Csx1 CARF domain-containing protein n=1 Tax=Ignisphaera aggregans TaxID=334771 RepID=A0A7C5UUT2_9CREN